jgi:hypothetical protein
VRSLKKDLLEYRVYICERWDYLFDCSRDSYHEYHLFPVGHISVDISNVFKSINVAVVFVNEIKWDDLANPRTLRPCLVI